MVYPDKFYKEIFNNISDGVYFVDVNRIITFWNDGAEIITGYKSSEVVGSSCSDNILVHVDDEGRQLCKEGCPLFETIRDGQKRNQSIYLHHKEGHRVHVDVSAYQIKTPEGKIIGAIEVFRDISSTMKDQETIENLKEADLLDIQTGLVNRRHMEMKLTSCLEEYEKHNVSFGIIMADIDNLKEVNNRYDRETGDKVVIMVAKTLAGNFRSYDLLCRWDGGKFAGIITHTNEKKILILSRKLRMLVENSLIYHNSTNINVTVTIGVTLTKYNDTFESLIDRVIILLSQGKNSGKNKVIIDSEKMTPHRKKKQISKQKLFKKRRLFLHNYKRYLIVLFSILLALLWLRIVFFN